MKVPRTLLAVCLLLAGPLLSQQRKEFLSPTEIDLVREAQEPADRVKLYVKFAQVRLDAMDKELEGNSADRGVNIHDLLYEYGRIIDAIDDQADLAITKRALLRKGLELAVKEEPHFVKRLQALEAKNPKDIEEYRFILRQALETTQDSLESLRAYLSKLPPDRKAEKKKKE